MTVGLMAAEDAAIAPLRGRDTAVCVPHQCLLSKLHEGVGNALHESMCLKEASTTIARE